MSLFAHLINLHCFCCLWKEGPTVACLKISRLSDNDPDESKSNVN